VCEGFCAGADKIDGHLHGGDNGLALLRDIECVGNESNVGEDVGESVGRECEDGVSGFEDSGEGFLAVGNGGDDEDWRHRQRLLCVVTPASRGASFCYDSGKLVYLCGPGVMNDGEVALAQLGDGVEAVFGAGGEGVEAAEVFENESDARLEGNDLHRYSIKKRLVRVRPVGKAVGEIECSRNPLLYSEPTLGSKTMSRIDTRLFH